MKIKKRTKAHRIYLAAEELNKALKLDDPHIRISLPYGVVNDPAGKEFITATRTFVQAYKKYFGLKEIDVELTV